MEAKELFKKMLLDNSYITWLSEFMKDRKEVDNLYYICNPETEISSNDIAKLEYLKFLYVELLIYFTKNGEMVSNIFCMKYKDKYYVLEKNDKWCCSCDVYDEPLYIDKEDGFYYTSKCLDYLEPLPYIEYEELRNQYTIEEKASANNIEATNLKDLLNKILECPSDFYVKICNALKPEEKLFLMKNLENKNCLNCINGSCRIEYQEKIGYDTNGNPQGSSCIGWENAELVGKSKVLKIMDINKLR